MRNTIKDTHAPRAGWFEDSPFVVPERVTRDPTGPRNQLPNQERRRGGMVARIVARGWVCGS